MAETLDAGGGDEFRSRIEASELEAAALGVEIEYIERRLRDAPKIGLFSITGDLLGKMEPLGPFEAPGTNTLKSYTLPYLN